MGQVTKVQQSCYWVLLNQVTRLPHLRDLTHIQSGSVITHHSIFSKLLIIDNQQLYTIELMWLKIWLILKSDQLWLKIKFNSDGTLTFPDNGQKLTIYQIFNLLSLCANDCMIINKSKTKQWFLGHIWATNIHLKWPSNSTSMAI